MNRPFGVRSLEYDALREYLLYMRQLGFTGLALDADPFAVSTKPSSGSVTPPVAPDPRRTAPRNRGAASVQARQQTLGTVLEFVSQGTNAHATRAKVQAVHGETVELEFAALHDAFADCQACALGTMRRKFVFGQGSLEADLMFVGEGPGREEDKQGVAFVGAAGQLLTRIIAAMGFTREDVFIGNVVKCRPPMNRKPLADEMATCGPILERQIELIAPKVIVALGATAFQFFKGQPVSIMRHRGTFFSWRSIRVMPTYHPAYLLRNPAAKRDVWEDMQRVMEELKESQA